MCHYPATGPVPDNGCDCEVCERELCRCGVPRGEHVIVQRVLRGSLLLCPGFKTFTSKGAGGGVVRPFRCYPHDILMPCAECDKAAASAKPLVPFGSKGKTIREERGLP